MNKQNDLNKPIKSNELNDLNKPIKSNESIKEKIVENNSPCTVIIKHKGIGNPIYIGKHFLQKNSTITILKRDLEKFLSTEVCAVVFHKLADIVKK